MRFLLLLLVSLPAIAQQPEARWISQVAYDEENKQVLLYGGAAKDTVFSDLWALKNKKWIKLGDQGLPARFKAAFTYDAGRRCAVLFGGSGDLPLMDETWEWDGHQWKQVHIPGPSPRNHPMAAYDRVNKTIVLFGGVGNSGLLSDTWVYNGKQWAQKDKAGPTNCLPHGMFYDEQRQKVIMITLASAPLTTDPKHTLNEMWEWSGHGWNRIPYTVTTSSASLQALASFNKNGIVLFDGDDSTDNRGKTWIFDGRKWYAVFLQGPSARVGHSMIFDKALHRTLLFGGSDRKNFFGDLWEWNGKKWIQVK